MNSQAAERFAAGTAVVTGAAAGIGEGFARHLAGIGMNIAVADIDGDRAAALVADMEASTGVRASAHVVDVADAQSVEDFAADVYLRYGSVELLINNAGVESAGLLWEIDEARWRRLMQINVDGVFHCIRAFVPRMIAAGTPSCVANLSSVGGFNSVAVQAPYIVSKHAVLAMTECLHQDLSIVGAPIQVSAVVPYSIRSEIFRSAQRDAPTTNPTANAVFAAMQRDNVERGLDPVEAAAHMVDQIAAGDFWVWSDDPVCIAAAHRRGQQLLELSPPSDPREMLTRMGVTVSQAAQ
ncbi:SDR family NAD(P)-dependent oxidoreductase [Gordonia terrae]|uniref:KR domain-containing protein n=2 Tax=Gordonia terrae TaxID=2055 RepID=A0AAD0K5A7_9ACTN|nr:SDR family NAD(P)-dependent oxidoreductase [Gordonia terrae]VTR09652.1 short-chain dehydrogenase/reductase SDR [Clostridioides difficile]ANY22258.1 short-chain dehydrogenase [Gordonia terrae]AWO82996.1 KR domain-containing protein [Gordonia terrae]VTS30718.1 3-oxoacyl-[acyl-carrier-protein] reductase FabG [Gordonia terrae]GAB46268.1 putative oxidoreductase [Gordonia terrae NBRC 100016]